MMTFVAVLVILATAALLAWFLDSVSASAPSHGTLRLSNEIDAQGPGAEEPASRTGKTARKP